MLLCYKSVRLQHSDKTVELKDVINEYPVSILCVKLCKQKERCWSEDERESLKCEEITSLYDVRVMLGAVFVVHVG